jgi:hypothetical protein
VVGKAEWTGGEANPRFVVTSLKPAEVEARHLYEGDLQQSPLFEGLLGLRVALRVAWPGLAVAQVERP